jgi:hypothetical protein
MADNSWPYRCKVSSHEFGSVWWWCRHTFGDDNTQWRWHTNHDDCWIFTKTAEQHAMVVLTWCNND